MATNSISGSIYFSGMGNGTDFSGVVDQLKEVESIYKKSLESWKSDWEVRYEAFEYVVDAMKECRTNLSALKTKDMFVEKTATSSDSTIAEATATSAAADGQHTINVSQIASNAIWANTGYLFSSKDDAINSTDHTVKFSYTYKDKEYSVDVPKGTSLSSFANLINNSSSNPGINVSVIQVGSGYVYQIAGKDSGADANLSINVSELNGMSSENGTVWQSTAPVDRSGQLYDTYTYSATLQDGKNVSFSMSGSATMEELRKKLGSYGAIKVSEESLPDGTANLALDGVISLTRTPSSGGDAQKISSPCVGGGSFTLTDDSLISQLDASTLNGTTVKLTDADGKTVSVKLSEDYDGLSTADSISRKMAEDINAKWADAYKEATGNDWTGGDVASVTTETDAEGAAVTKLSLDTVRGVDFEVSPFNEKASFSAKFSTKLEGYDAAALQGEGQDITYSLVDSMGNTCKVQIASGSTYEQLADKINADLASAGGFEGAEVHFDADGKLVGTNISSISGSGIKGGVTESGSWAIQSSCDARFTVDNWPYELTSTSNTISNVLSGLTVKIYNTGSTKISVGTDADAMVENIQTFLDSVNKVLKTINTLSDIESKGDKVTASALTGNYGIQLLASRMKTAMSSSPAGFNKITGDDLLSGDLISALSQLGIKTCAVENDENYGLFVIAPNSAVQSIQDMDRERFDDAITNSIQAVADFFASSGEGSSSTSQFRYASHVGGIAKSGSYEVKYDVDADGNISNVTIGGNPCNVDTSMEGNWYTCASGDAKSLAIQIDDLTPGTHSGTVSIKQGLIGTMYDFFNGELSYNDLDTENNGAVYILMNNYQKIMNNIQDKIDKEEDRISNWETRQRQYYAKLDSLLSSYESQKTSLESQLKSLGNK